MDKQLKEHLILQYLEAKAEEREAKAEQHTHIASYSHGLQMMVRKIFVYYKCEAELDRLVRGL